MVDAKDGSAEVTRLTQADRVHNEEASGKWWPREDSNLRPTV